MMIFFQGKDHVRVIERIDNIQKQLEELKARHTTLYCNYVMQATVTDHKTGAMDALKGDHVYTPI